jgi:hypothetical protein
MKFPRRQNREEMSGSACAGKADPGTNLAHLLRIFPYCSRRVTIAFVYALQCTKSEAPIAAPLQEWRFWKARAKAHI